MTPQEFAHKIDHTLLKPEATPAQVDALCDEAIEHGFASVCVNPVYVSRAVRRLDGCAPFVGTAVGFPLGANDGRTIVEEARRAIEHGAREIDMATWIGGLVAGEKKAVAATTYEVACAVHQQGAEYILKVTLETAALTDEQIILGCRCLAEGEADYVKTSTGFHAAGGAAVEHVQLMHRHASPLKIIAAGGIRTLDGALALLEAGAVRLGVSDGVALVEAYAERVVGR